MMSEAVQTIIIGAGQSGLSLSYHLQQRGIRHLVLERERAFSQWYKVWDNFYMNTANWLNNLPGEPQPFAAGQPRGGLGRKADALAYFQAYLDALDPPLIENCPVTRVRPQPDGTWQVDTPQAVYHTPNVAVCIGNFHRPNIPPFAAALPSSVPQLHSSRYRNPAQITTPNVFVVGSGNSGVQICDDLARAGRFERLYLALSGNRTVPYRLLGVVPTYEIVRLLRLQDLRVDTWPVKWVVHHLEGKGDPAFHVSPKKLARAFGVRLVGRAVGVSGENVTCSDGSRVPLQDLTVLWCTGYRADYDFIEVQPREKAFDERGRPRHRRGVVPGCPGLFFVGLRFQSIVASHNIYGCGHDAAYIAGQIAQRLEG